MINNIKNFNYINNNLIKIINFNIYLFLLNIFLIKFQFKNSSNKFKKMNNYLHKYAVVKSNSKNIKNKQNETLMLYYNKKANIINFKNIFRNRDLNNSKYKTNKNSRKYISNISI